MDFQEKLLDSLKEVFRLKLILLASVVCISVYLLDRSSQLMGGQLDPVSFNSQAAIHSLNFSFFSLSILWPLLLATLVHIYIAVSNRSAYSYQVLIKSCDDAKTLIPAFFEEKYLPSKLRKGISWLPIISATIYALTLILFMLDKIISVPSDPNDPSNTSNISVGVGVYFSLVAYVLVFPLALYYLKSFKNHFWNEKHNKSLKSDT
jgi:hypothetical protein